MSREPWLRLIIAAVVVAALLGTLVVFG